VIVAPVGVKVTPLKCATTPVKLSPSTAAKVEGGGTGTLTTAAALVQATRRAMTATGGATNAVRSRDTPISALVELFASSGRASQSPH
jgi:hypothetical protein